MSADVRHVLVELGAALDRGDVVALAVVTAHEGGGIAVHWGADKSLGAHAGTMLRGMAAYLGSQMDGKAEEE